MVEGAVEVIGRPGWRFIFEFADAPVLRADMEIRRDFSGDTADRAEFCFDGAGVALEGLLEPEICHHADLVEAFAHDELLLELELVVELRHFAIESDVDRKVSLVSESVAPT